MQNIKEGYRVYVCASSDRWMAWSLHKSEDRLYDWGFHRGWMIHANRAMHTASGDWTRYG